MDHNEEKFTVVIFLIMFFSSLLAFSVLNETEKIKAITPREDIEFAQTLNIKNQVEQCLEKVTLVAVNIFSFADSEKSIEWYIESNIKSCVGDFSEYSVAGMHVVQGDVDATVMITPQNLAVHLKYPIVIYYGDKVYSYSDFNYFLNRNIEVMKRDGVVAAVVKR